jgi:transcriptional regulator GlxA family with amidase domain
MVKKGPGGLPFVSRTAVHRRRADLSVPAKARFNSYVSDPRIQLAVELLQRSAFERPCQLNTIAAELNISTSHLRHLFSREIGVPPARYFKVIRLRRAREIIECSFVSVKEAMVTVGFTDLSHFVRDYKNLHGHWPSESRLIAMGRSQRA